MKKLILFAIITAGAACKLFSQGFTRQTFHDLDKKQIKEVFQVKDTLRNILHGRYISYFVNGSIESKGQFTNNETTGVWEFFYETGNLKMRGILRQNANYGLWEYFYESGQKSMEGNINGKLREGEWKTYYENGQVKETGSYKNNKRQGIWTTYFEDGVIKGAIDYIDDFGNYTEYYHSGKVAGQGPRDGTRNSGLWQYFGEDGSLQSQGEYSNGKRNGEWLTYFPSGKTASRGKYLNDVPVDTWEHFFEDGTISEAGDYTNGSKSGTWKLFNSNGSVKSEENFNGQHGDYREYYANGKIKRKGKSVDGKREGKWEFFSEDGKKEGECDYQDGKGTYYGYYPNGNLQTKGTLEGDLKTGTWEIYQNDGKLSGYYRPFYESSPLSKEIATLASKGANSKSANKTKKLTHFDARFNEFRGVIVEGNPLLVFAGRLPVGIEFYLQERLGHEFEFIGIREPFFKSDLSIPAGKIFERGYAISLKQKLYNQTKAGMWYFGHEIRFTNYGHFINQPITGSSVELFTFSAVEQRIEWGLLLGYRLMRRNNREGFTIDTFFSADVGYRGFDVDPRFAYYFKDINQAKLATSFHLGLNFGNVFSFR